MPLPEWLPDLLEINPWGADTFDMLYQVFEADIKNTGLTFNANPVWYFPEIEDDKEVIFWHLTHREDRTAQERLPDTRRCERLNWIRPILENENEPEVLWWDYEEYDRTIKTYIWLQEYDFLIILKKYPDGGRRLITSYFVEYQHAKNKLRKKYDQRVQ